MFSKEDRLSLEFHLCKIPTDIPAWISLAQLFSNHFHKFEIFERALRQVPWSLKLWLAYLDIRESQLFATVSVVGNSTVQLIPSPTSLAVQSLCQLYLRATHFVPFLSLFVRALRWSRRVGRIRLWLSFATIALESLPPVQQRRFVQSIEFRKITQHTEIPSVLTQKLQQVVSALCGKVMLNEGKSIQQNYSLTQLTAEGLHAFETIGTGDGQFKEQIKMTRQTMQSALDKARIHSPHHVPAIWLAWMTAENALVRTLWRSEIHLPGISLQKLLKKLSHPPSDCRLFQQILSNSSNALQKTSTSEDSDKFKRPRDTESSLSFTAAPVINTRAEQNHQSHLIDSDIAKQTALSRDYLLKRLASSCMSLETALAVTEDPRSECKPECWLEHVALRFEQNQEALQTIRNKQAELLLSSSCSPVASTSFAQTVDPFVATNLRRRLLASTLAESLEGNVGIPPSIAFKYFIEQNQFDEALKSLSQLPVQQRRQGANQILLKVQQQESKQSEESVSSVSSIGLKLIQMEETLGNIEEARRMFQQLSTFENIFEQWLLFEAQYGTRQSFTRVFKQQKQQQI